VNIFARSMNKNSEITRRQKVVQLIRPLVVILSLSLLFWWALRKAPLKDIWVALTVLHWWQLIFLLGINAIVIALITARWWLIARTAKQGVPFLPLVWYRLAVFGLSYFTPGPQIGGEPLQVIYLQRNHGFTYARATATVIMDKLVEFLTNFVLLAVGFWAVFQTGLLSIYESPSEYWLIGLAILLIWPLLHIILLYRKILPITNVLKAIPFLNKKSKAIRMIYVSERLASVFCQRHTRTLLVSIGISMVALMGIIAEYFLMARFLGIKLSTIELFAALTFLQLAFLVPLPGGLGALEASQVFALGMFGQPAAVAISLTLLQRVRDVLNGGLGLLIAAKNIASHEG